jgi:hypothetical protein
LSGCNQCGLCCHKECYGMVPVTCGEVEILKNQLPQYFVAPNRDECKKWIKMIDSTRRAWLNQMNK